MNTVSKIVEKELSAIEFGREIGIGEVQNLTQKVITENPNLSSKINAVRDEIFTAMTYKNAKASGYSGPAPTPNNPYPDELEDFFRDGNQEKRITDFFG